MPEPKRQMLPSEFLAKPSDLPNITQAHDRDALHALLTEVLPHVLREAAASNSRLKSIQMPEVISLKDHTDACKVVFEMLQSPEMLQTVVLMLLQHTLGAMFKEEGVGDMFEAALWDIEQVRQRD
jgi:hypothetical protein